MDSIKTFWSKVMEMPEARLFIAFVGLAIGLIVVYYVVMLFRNMAIGGPVESVDYIAEFRQLRDEGKLDDEEYERLSKVIPTHLMSESNEQTEHTD